ncbi:hypothetical protein HGA13_22780 [Nocardia speluncae]|uniref:Uncharacterized protein n=1 Tax=Nocardia speluncae TaxID=419477 RepID=A0A846XQF5_9NOCA|nr:hypothetical protein [Nocardia speluncae]NKY35874.1 hypothetical protein [Nocardia speluncae]
MADDGKRPFQSQIDAAREGQLSMSFSDDIRVNAEEFVYMDRDCAAMKDRIRVYQGIAKGIANRELWGLGEDPATWPRSGKVLVQRFRDKAMGDESGNSVHAILERHYQIIDGIQELHRVIAQRYLDTDSEFASRYNEVMASAPQGFQGQQ